ncbi:MAG: hypothetical protein JSR60_06225 [Proteobacteria bacterium]|nr:hypothetical protein [Pseudomonadota bacterium]
MRSGNKQVQGRKPVRSALLIGTSALAIVLGSQAALADDAAPATAPADPAKWAPFVSVGGKAGPNVSGGEVTGFDPVWQDLNSLLYVRLGIGAPTNRSAIGNIGLGYRTKIDPEWIVGGYAGVDFTQSHGRSYSQGSLGFEAMSADWDVRLNGYLSFDSKPNDVLGSYSLFIHDTRIAILKEQEFAYSGFEGEVGYRVFNTDNFDIRVFGGAYSFTRDSTKATLGGVGFNLGPGTIAGPMGRAEFELHDLDLFGPQSRLTFTAEVSDDDVHGSTAYVGVALRVPLNVDNSDPAPLDDLDRRMVDDVRRRDGVMIESGYTKPEPVIIYNGTITSEPTNTLYYVDNSTGAGSYADPTTFADATGRGPKNQFVVLTDREGNVNATGVTVQHGETVAGPGVFKVKGVDSGTVFTHDFAPHSGPVTVSTADGITLDSDTRLFGFDIDSTAPNAIYGHNVTDVVIGDVNIDGGGVGTNGIYIHQDSGTSGSIDIVNTNITGVTGTGIGVIVDNSLGTTATQNISLTNVTVDAGTYGVLVDTTVSGGSNETVNLGIHDSTLTGGFADLSTTATVSAGSVLSNNVTIDPTYLTGGYYGFVSHAYADGGTLNQTIDLSQVYVSGATYSGVYITGIAANGGTVNQTVTMDIVDVVGSNIPVGIVATATGAGSQVEQTVTANNLSVSDGYFGGITFVNYADHGGSSHQYATLFDVSAINTRYGDGLDVIDEAFDGGTAIQRLDIYGLTATGNYYDGVNLRSDSGIPPLYVGPGASAVAAQYISIADSNISDNGYNGVTALAVGLHESIARQDVTIVGSSLDYNDGYGFFGLAAAGDSGGAEQHVYLVGDDISYNGFGGASINAIGYSLGSVQQTVYMLGDYALGNGGDGIAITASAIFAGQVNQTANLYYAYSVGNVGDGLFLGTEAYGYDIGTYSVYYSHIGQQVIAAYADFSHNLRNGVEIQNYAGYGAQLNQFVYLFDVGMNHNGPSSGPIPTGAGNGLFVQSTAEAYGLFGGAVFTNLYSDIYVVGSQANHNASDGLHIEGSAYGPTYMIQTIEVGNTQANNNSGNGFFASDYAGGFYSLNIQYLTLANSTFNGNGIDGASLISSQVYGPLSFGLALQEVTIANSDFSHNLHDGLYASLTASDFQGRAEQYFTIQNSHFDYNSVNGAEFDSYVGPGVYYAGYNCGLVQGTTGGCAIGRENIQIVGSEFNFNGVNGIYVDATAYSYGALYAASGRPLYQPTLLIAYTDASHNGNDGLRIDNTATGDSYLYSYFVGLGSTFDSNGNHGIEINTTADSGSVAIQKTILYGVPGYMLSSASYNGGDGLNVTTTATGGTVQQLVGIYGSYLYYNGDAGAKISGHAYEPVAAGTPGYVADPTLSVIGQYVKAIGNVFYGNGLGATPGSYEGGLIMGSFAYGFDSVAQQYATVQNNAFIYNYLGLAQGGFAFQGGAVNQSLDSEYNIFALNNVGEFQLAHAEYLGFVTQSLYDNYNVIELNGLGLGVVADAYSGANVTQNLNIYNDAISNNLQGGMVLNTYAGGYAFGYSLYYSHVTQNLIAAYDHLNYNGGNGITISDVAFYGGAENLFRYFFDVQAAGNTNDGLYDGATITSFRGNDFGFSTNITSSLYAVSSDFSGNGASGLELRSYNYGPTYLPAFFGGYSYLIQHNFIIGTTADDNTLDGLTVLQNASGVYGLNAQYFTISGSTFDHNVAAGAHFVSSDSYGPGSFGDTFQQITITGSDFSGNTGDGITLEAFASGRQGRAEQHTTISGSTMNYNGGDGLHIYASATDGVYIAGHPCDTAQGLPGGCSFVRQDTTVTSSDISYNAGNGVFSGAYANNYGAIYGASGRPHSPTLELYGVTVDHNTLRGMNISDHVSGSSYLYQYVAAIDSNFDHNGSDGIYAATYVGGGSVALQRHLLYSYHYVASAAYNASNGFKSTIEALGGSYARDVNIVEGVDLSNDGSFGFDGAVAYADGSSTGLQINALYFNTINHNGDGVGFYSIGPGAQQISYVGINEIAYNAFVGAYGEANFGAFQYIGIYTFGNNVHDNGTDYLFNAFGGSTQILN